MVTDHEEEKVLKHLFQLAEPIYSAENLESEVMEQIRKQRNYEQQKRRYSQIGQISFGVFLLLCGVYLSAMMGKQLPPLQKPIYYMMGSTFLLFLGFLQLEISPISWRGLIKNILAQRVVLVFFWLLIGVSMKGQDFDSKELFSRWEQSERKQPGMSLAVLKDGQVILQKSRGYANLEYDIPLTNKSVFDIASLAKQFTGFAIAKLHLEGQLDLDMPTADILPELPILQKGIRIRHLVYHTSGLRDVAELYPLTYLAKDLTVDVAMDILANQQELNFLPGTTHDYSNTNYILLAKIVERVSGQSFRSWCQGNIFAPLGMEHTFVNDNPTEIISNRAVAYYTDGQGFSFMQNNGMALIGSSAVYSTIEDMVVWGQALQNESLFPKIFHLMKQKGELDTGAEVEYGFGLGLGNIRDTDLIEHTGATPAGFRTAMAIFPEHSLAIIVLSNWGDIDPIREVGTKIIEVYLPSVEETKVEKNRTEDSILHLSDTVLVKYTGDYLFNGEMNVKIMSGSGGKLSVQIEGGPLMKLLPLSATDFDLPAMQSRLKFEQSSAESISKAEVWMNGEKEGELVRVLLEEPPKKDWLLYEGLYYSEELKVLYEIKYTQEGLSILNTNRGSVILDHKAETVFTPQKGIASSLVFQYDPDGNVTGFLLSRGSRARNLKFRRL